MGKIFRFSDFGMHFRSQNRQKSQFSRWVAFFPHFWAFLEVIFGGGESNHQREVIFKGVYKKKGLFWPFWRSKSGQFWETPMDLP